MVTMTAELFAAPVYEGVPIQQVGEDADRYVALGHVNPTVFAAAANAYCRKLIESDDFDPMEPGDVQHVWAVLTDPSTWTAPDEWGMRWGAVCESTPDAFPITVLTCD